MKMKKIFLTVATILALTTQTFAASLNLSGGESAIMQANVNTSVTCGGGYGPVPQPQPDNGLAQCLQDKSYFQNELYKCQNQNQTPKVWNCTYTCGSNNGMGSDVDKAAACNKAKRDSGVQCSSQCECARE